MSLQFGPQPGGRVTRFAQAVATWLARILRAPTPVDGSLAHGPTGVDIRYQGRWIRLHGGRVLGDPRSVFHAEVYRWLPVRGATVVDIGASIGDSPIYFHLAGAERVVAFEPNPVAWALMVWNLHAGQISGVEPRCRAIARLDDASVGEGDWVLKMDCEGAEEWILAASTSAAIRRFSHIILEYHHGPEASATRLREAGFEVFYDPPTVEPDGKRVGILRATRSAPFGGSVAASAA